MAVCAGAAVFFAFQLGTAAGVSGESLLTALRAVSEKRVLLEREQIRHLLDLAAQGREEEARLAGEGMTSLLPENAQLHLFLAEGYRARGLEVPALREYRRVVEMDRVYLDRRFGPYLGNSLKPWLRRIRPRLREAAGRMSPDAGPALRDLYFLERGLAGGCA